MGPIGTKLWGPKHLGPSYICGTRNATARTLNPENNGHLVSLRQGEVSVTLKLHLSSLTNQPALQTSPANQPY